MAKIELHTHIESIGEQRWQQLCSQDDSFLHFHYLAALESSGCVGEGTAWLPQHLVVSDDESDIALLPLYLKTDSYGEFVFDWSWARAAQQAGIPYYPKLVTSIPYTPVSGPRFGCAESAALPQLLEGIATAADTLEVSSWHLLFGNQASIEALRDVSGNLQLMERQDCHFVWANQNYESFDHFLQGLNSRKRKSIRRERRKVAEQNIHLQRFHGDALTDEHIDIFFEFYRIPYLQRGRAPYLNRTFFQYLHQHLKERLMLVLATRDQQPVASALFVQGTDYLSGRWWGGLPGIDCLHFEACYYQGIEYAIEQGLARFDPGIQGEHKLVRGFEPEITRSLHWIREPRLASAVDRFLQQERQHIAHYQQQARQHLPFRQPDD